eukprot:scaffold36055_cov39-Phaeocystis_antarctica.AAC.1
MPAAADSRVLFWSQDALPWVCSGGEHAAARGAPHSNPQPHSNPHAAAYCTDARCKLARPGGPQVCLLEPRGVITG